MINLFKKQVSKNFWNVKTQEFEATPTIANPITDPKAIREIIEEIHETFYTEVDRLLAEAKISKSLDTDKQELIDKCARLEALGFTSTKEVKEANAEILRLEKLKQENDAKGILVDAINYFSFKYPNYKFITEDSVLKICEKYNLIYGPIDRYIGDVPDKNLKHIEDFKVVEDDECFVYEERMRLMFGEETSIRKEYITKRNFTEKNNIENIRYSRLDLNSRKINMKCPLEIAAPLKDFDMQGMEIKSYKMSKIEVPDPIVLKPVIFKGQKHYLIVTAWGLEASDEMVVNQKFN